jgi:hypothetical protein
MKVFLPSGNMSGKNRKPGRRALTKGDLLPLPSAKVRAMSLQNHLALATASAGAGDADQVSCLLRVVYLAWHLRDVLATEADRELFRQGEQALERCIERSVANDEWTLPEPEQAIVGQILLLHDAQLAAVSAHRYLRASEQMQAFLRSGRASVVN